MIYISRIVTVSKGSSLIDEQIVLYKGDRNVEVQFTLKNNPFKEKNGATSTYATFGQLIINRDAGPIISEVSQMSNNRVVFIITGEMIDEFEEVGNYSFQIRLFNEDQSSRATLPPVKDGIVIDEPICEEATVNTTYVNSEKAVVMPANDGIMLLAAEPEDIFDTDGSYNRTNWCSGDIITDARLNKVEEALYQINDDIPTDYATEEYVDDSVRSTRYYVIDNYATTSYVDNAIEAIDVDVEGYATEEFVAESIRNSGHATESYVNSAVSSSQRQIEDYMINNYVSNSDIEDYATKDYVGEAIDNIEIPDTDLTGYATEAYVDKQIEANALDIMEIGSDDPNNRYKFTGNEFSDEDYMEHKSKSVLLKNTIIEFDNGAFYSFNNELVNIQLGGFPEDKELAIYRSNGLIIRISVIDGRFTLLGEDYFATESYVDNAIANIEGGGSSSLDIMTIGSDDPNYIYYFTGDEFSDEDYILAESKPALLKNVVVDGAIMDEDGFISSSFRVSYNNELVNIKLSKDDDGDRYFTIYSPCGTVAAYYIERGGTAIYFMSYDSFTTEQYVKETLQDYPTYGDIKSSVEEAIDANMPNIMEIGGGYFNDYFTEDDYKNNVQQAVLLNRIDGSNYYGELAHITLGWDKSTSTRTITIDSILGHTEIYSVQEDGSLMLDERICFATDDTINSMLDKRNYATQDYVDNMLGDVDSILGGI